VNKHYDDTEILKEIPSFSERHMDVYQSEDTLHSHSCYQFRKKLLLLLTLLSDLNGWKSISVSKFLIV
jgi:hypothetical protein